MLNVTNSPFKLSVEYLTVPILKLILPWKRGSGNKQNIFGWKHSIIFAQKM